jgi:hypothetical protein
MGSRTTSSNELKKLGSRMMPGFFRGVYAAGKQPVRDSSTHFCIVNTMSGPLGQHWLGLYREGHRELLYDLVGAAIAQHSGRNRSTLAKRVQIYMMQGLDFEAARRKAESRNKGEVDGRSVPKARARGKPGRGKRFIDDSALG